MTVRLRVLELMAKHKPAMAGAYQLVQAVAKLSRANKPTDATIYRLVRSGGVIKSVRADTLETLAEVFGCEVPDLFERSGRRKK